MKNNIKIGITIGDANGIGPEIIIKTFLQYKTIRDQTIIIYSSVEIIEFYLQILKLNLTLSIINSIEEAKIGKFNILPINNNFKVTPGLPSKESGQLAYEAIFRASKDILMKKIDVIVTGPIDKKSIQNSNFPYNGHTEFFTNIANKNDALMLMVKGKLRVGIVTNHIPVKEIAKALTHEKILSKISLLNQALKDDFKIKHPKIAVLGLNPHAGDNGVIGYEEKQLIKPVINQTKNRTINAEGLFSADGFFSSGNYKKYDAVLAMYHDQGLIPFKMLSKNQGVNFTAGLPFIRTSPDHGTAYDIAGKNLSSPHSFKNAIELAKQIFIKRNE
jgi:4-hydroxythreonine-4-phosphate dehydrogenase